MIAYDKTFLENTLLVEQAVDLKKSGFIPAESLHSIKQQLNTLRTNRNILVRIAFLVLGAFLYVSIIGAVSLFAIDSGPDFYIIGFLVSGIGLGMLELLCRRGFFRHGLDDSFVIGSQLAFYSTILSGSDSVISLSAAMIIVGLLFAVRYISISSFVVFLSGIVLLIVTLLIEYTTIPSILPFVLLLLAVGLYAIYVKIKDKAALYIYDDMLRWFSIFCLFLGYASVNYFVVRTLSEELLSADYSNSDVPFGWIFYILMFAIPIGYITYSLQQKNRIMLYIGGLTFVLSIATFRYYHSILPTEWALLLSGSALFAFVYFVIQKLKNKEVGITFKHDHTNDTATLNNIEALVVNSQDIKHAEEIQSSDMPFGGGGFSGGGSGSSF